MKTFFKTTTCALVLLFASKFSMADYRTSLGLRAGKFLSDVEIKHCYNANRFMGMEFHAGYTLEANSGYQAKIFQIAQFPIWDSKLQIPVDLIFGAGIHGGYFKEKY